MCDDWERVSQQSVGQYSGAPGSSALARGAVALVWTYQGLWCKLLARCPSHFTLLSSLPPPLGSMAGPMAIAIGVTEVALAAWVLIGWKMRGAAWAQTLLLAVMNGGGLIWGRASITDPAAMVIQNVAFLALVWTVANDRG